MKKTINPLKQFSNEELLTEIRERIIAGTVLVEWEDTYGDSSTITDLSTRCKGTRKQWFYLNFDEALREYRQKEKTKK